jgi:hypothetical protein
MTATIFVVIVVMASVSNTILFTVLPTQEMQWTSFFGQLAILGISTLVLFVMAGAGQNIKQRVYTKRKITGTQLLAIGSIVLTLALAIWMYIEVNN